MSEDWMDFGRFISTFQLKLDKEFDRDGIAASWAPSTNGAPLLWGNELNVLELSDDALSETAEKPRAYMVLSPDGKFVAISTNCVVRIYSVDSMSVTAEFTGHEDMVETVQFWLYNNEDEREVQYIIFSQDSEPVGADGVIMAWHLNKEGKLVDDQETSVNFEGKFLSGDAAALSCNKNRLLHSDRSLSTQGWDRPSDWLPQLVIRSLSDPATEVCRLKGHQDAIKWAAWSPTDPNIVASSSWDRTCGIWNAATGESVHIIQHSNGQNWTGDFSPNGEHVVLAAQNLNGTENVAIYAVATGSCIQRLEMPNLGSWSTPLSWSPNGGVVALGIDRSVFLLDVAKNTTSEVIKVHSDGNLRDRYCSITSLKWLDRKGEKLLIRLTDHTMFIWDMKSNLKWRLQRPSNVQELRTHWSSEVFIEDKSLLLSLDGDWRVRTWEIKA
ncbi:hypothetical protein VHEMI07409 [[Torrubiella] hemipterigena]|uniref:Uncharacterized protein n=1 Tax=[Torrubiella] hemipterigena TaxID=1531966 RepID=A0A0A1T3I2_9HYPO|nr:hypothetical protein VHEMI07409 [[Torrubiella] hemipterigena]